MLFGGISVYLQQYSALFRKTPRFLDRLWDSPRVIAAFAGRGVSPDARVLGELTISTLQGEQGVLRKEFEKLVEWTKDEPPPDVINLPNSLLIAMAAPLKRAFKRPVLCTLQGEELFLSELRRSVPRSRARVDSGAGPARRSVHRRQRVLCGVHDALPGDSAGSDLRGAARHQHGGLQRGARQASRADEYRVGYFARVAPEKGLHELANAYVRLQAARRQRRRSRCRSPVTWRRTTAATSRRRTTC